MRQLLLAILVALPVPALAQDAGMSPPPFDQKKGGSENVKVLKHVENNPGAWKAADIEIEQDRNRPYVYVSGFVNFDVTDLRHQQHRLSPKKIFDWTIENPELHAGIGAMDGKYFKIGGRYYYAQSYQFLQGSPDADLGAVIFDVTGLPDPVQGEGSGADPVSRSRRAGSTTPSPTSTPTAGRCTSRRSARRRRWSTTSTRS